MSILKKIKHWWKLRKLEKELDKELTFDVNRTSTRIMMQQNQLKYQEGLSALKQQINAEVEDKTSEGFDRVLKSKDDLVSLSEDTEDSKDRLVNEVRKKMFVEFDKDIKTRKDKKDMLTKRIQHYDQLQKHKINRILRRNIRAAYSEGNSELAKRLEKELK